MEEFSNQPKFEVGKSPMREAYELLRTHTPLELSNLYREITSSIKPDRFFCGIIYSIL